MKMNANTPSDSNKEPVPHRFFIVLFSCVFTIALVAFCYLRSESLKEVAMSFSRFPDPMDNLVEKDSVQLVKHLRESQRRNDNLQTRIDALSPNGPYLIVNTTRNTFVLRTRKGVIRESVCSTGSYIMLDAGEGQQWIFKTPKGQFRILGKITHPVWRKPDWNFVEEGLPIPSQNDPDRYEYGTLGDYALSLGQGYLIHGTLYQRLLGLPVTHGCIRLGDDDLKAVYNALVVGSKVYIF